MFDALTQYVSGSPWTYAFLFAVAALDVIIPFVPSETSVILAGVLASTGDLMLWLVILCAAGGAILGDNTAYWIGRKAGHRIVARWFQGERRKRIDWAEEQIQERGGYLILIGRFIPGGPHGRDADLRPARDDVAPVHPLRRGRRLPLGRLCRHARLLRRAGLRGAAVEGVPARVRDRAR